MIVYIFFEKYYSFRRTSEILFSTYVSRMARVGFFEMRLHDKLPYRIK